MKNSDMPAMPCNYSKPSKSSDPLATPIWVEAKGLTKLEHLAGLVMQGIMASGDAPSFVDSKNWNESKIIGDSIDLAQALLDELEKNK